MGPDTPLISIVTPSKNHGRFVEETIRSVLEQDYPHVEYMVLDGGSKDGTVDVIRRYQDRLAYWVSEPDGGQTDAINKGFARAKGEFLMWLNSDDFLLPGALRAVAEGFSSDPEVGIIHGDAITIDEDGNRRGVTRSGPFTLEGHITGKGPFMVQPSAFMRRKVMESIGPLDASLRYAMDYQVWLLAGYRFKFHYLPKVLSVYRDHPGTKRSEINTRYHEEGKLVMDRLFAQRDLPDSIRRLAPDAYRTAIFYFIVWNGAKGTTDFLKEYWSKAWEDSLLTPSQIEALGAWTSLNGFQRSNQADAIGACLALHRGLAGRFPEAGIADPEAWARKGTADFLLDLAAQQRDRGRRRPALRLLREASRLHAGILLRPQTLGQLVRCLI
ncbi:MAG: glycosyltransferase [Nitrospirae bacterium]|nr:glycosyltransferase [Nitrospirota bacterium]